MIALALLALGVVRCHAGGTLPDPSCTPGAVATTSLAVVCGTSTRTRRHVDAQIRARVLAAYGIPASEASAYELDHLVPLACGGSNAESNLWPEPLVIAHEKDQVENEAHRRVCSGRLPLAVAQARFAKDWRGVLE